MKKEKKNKKSDSKEVKDSKKEIKKKLAHEEKSSEVHPKKTKSPTTPDIQPNHDVDYDSLKKVMLDCTDLYQNIIALPRSYHTSDGPHSLYPSELKALNMIGLFSGINLTQLANKLDISKSAVSKCSSKLLEKGLIAKEKSQANVREVVFTLSETGQCIFDQLEDSNSALFKPIDTCIESLSNREISEIHGFFCCLNEGLTSVHKKLEI